MQIIMVDVAQPPGAEEQAWLSGEERARAGRYRCSQSRAQFVATRVALRALLGRRLGRPPGAVEFRYQDGGKPYVAELREQGTEFSISHSGARSLIAISDGGAVGVDIEERRPIEVRELAAAYFTAAETAWLAGTAEPHALKGFYRIWVRKEAAAKALGCGIGVGLDRFETARHGRGLLPAKVRMPNGEVWFCRELPLDPRFEAVLVSRQVLPDCGVELSCWSPRNGHAASIRSFFPAASTPDSLACARIQ